MDPQRFERLLVAPGATIREAIEAIDAGAIEIALVVDPERRVLATVSDGDVRRALLAGAGLDDVVERVQHDKPITAPAGTDPAELVRMMTEHGIEQIPLLQDGRVVDVAFLRELVAQPVGNPVVLMAGGEGRRLRPLTDATPKPMLQVGDRPLLETVLGQVKQAGFSKVLMAVNYRANIIEDHFGDGAAMGLDISYVREERALGSAGALQLIREELDQPFIVMNADLLTNVNLGALLRFHLQETNLITIGVRQCLIEVPYGVVDIEGPRVLGLQEKPQLSFFVNAGIYAVSPDAFALLPPDVSVVNMTDLIDTALAQQDRVGCFPIREYWLDVGQLSDYDRAHDDHATYFSQDT